MFHRKFNIIILTTMGTGSSTSMPLVISVSGSLLGEDSSESS